jgi:small subunit ribosomal protein S9
MKEGLEEYIGTGRRKTAVASVRMRPGTGAINVNGKAFEQYFPLELQRTRALAPLTALSLEGKYDLLIRCKGGGVEGQADAVKLGLARALVEEEAERRGSLKRDGFLKRDSRKK